MRHISKRTSTKDAFRPFYKEEPERERETFPIISPFAPSPPLVPIYQTLDLDRTNFPTPSDN
jgi:hypothetical protein